MCCCINITVEPVSSATIQPFNNQSVEISITISYLIHAINTIDNKQKATQQPSKCEYECSNWNNGWYQVLSWENVFPVSTRNRSYKHFHWGGTVSQGILMSKPPHLPLMVSFLWERMIVACILASLHTSISSSSTRTFQNCHVLHKTQHLQCLQPDQN